MLIGQSLEIQPPGGNSEQPSGQTERAYVQCRHSQKQTKYRDAENVAFETSNILDANGALALCVPLDLPMNNTESAQIEAKL